MAKTTITPRISPITGKPVRVYSRKRAAPVPTTPNDPAEQGPAKRVTAANAPTAAQISALAQQVQPLPHPAKYYINSIVLLNARGFGATQIAEWLLNNGCGEYTSSSISSALSRWKHESASDK